MTGQVLRDAAAAATRPLPAEARAALSVYLEDLADETDRAAEQWGEKHTATVYAAAFELAHWILGDLP